GNLTSIFSNYGNLPLGGFNNANFRQTFDTDAEFHSVELNYRRRVVGPYCRFQGSWLFGIRHLVYDNGFSYNGFDGTNTINGFTFNSDVDNRFLGAQVGFDLWYNAAPGISFGSGLKGAWGQNDISQALSTSNANDPISVGGRDGTVLIDLNTTLVYRLSYSLAFRSSHHLIAMDDVAQPTLDQQFLIDYRGAATPAVPVNEGSLVLQGATFGIEYLW
ncbi:MAG: hypothetical protein AAF745_18315, partial [Planctomycetota bacterium]